MAQTQFRRLFVFVAASFVWGAMVVGIASLKTVETELDHRLCGVWGCSPPVAAVLSMHGLWGMVLIPAAILVRLKFSKRVGKIVGLTAISVAMAAMAALFVYEYFHWYTFVREESRQYIGRRLALSLFSQTDFPIVLLLLSGILLRWLSLGRIPDSSHALKDQSESFAEWETDSNRQE